MGLFVEPWFEHARADILAFTAFPNEVRRQIWPNNPNDRKVQPVRSAAAPIWAGSSPDRPAIARLVDAVLAEQNDEWAEAAATSD